MLAVVAGSHYGRVHGNAIRQGVGEVTARIQILLSTADVARRARCSPDLVRHEARAGVLREAFRTGGRFRLFDPAEVQRWLRAREDRRRGARP
jgi:hypothetical protein